MAELETELLLREDDGQITGQIFSRERGEDKREPHLNGHIDCAVNEGFTFEEAVALVETERKWLREVMVRGNDRVSFMLTVKVCTRGERAYWHGYDQKDEGLMHYLTFNSNKLSPSYLQHAREVYHAKAGQNSYAGSGKMNKVPGNARKQLDITVGNLFTITPWFISEHGLMALHQYISLALTVSWALATTRYRLDESVIAGKNGGLPLDPVRSAALFKLSVMPRSALQDINRTLPLVQNVLHAKTSECDTTDDDYCWANNLPTCTELHTYSLDQAKAWCVANARHDSCAQAAACADDETQEAELASQTSRNGRAVVIDFFSNPSSMAARHLFAEAGLEVNSLFSRNQLPMACGYLSAAWACALRERGDETFFDYTLEDAATFNHPAYIQQVNTHILNRPHLGTTADPSMLTGEDVIRIVTTCNPDRSDRTRGAKWFSSPMPMNFFESRVAETVANPSKHGKTHFVVVNTERQTRLSNTIGGIHWFLTAWYIEPDENAMAP